MIHRSDVLQEDHRTAAGQLAGVPWSRPSGSGASTTQAAVRVAAQLPGSVVLGLAGGCGRTVVPIGPPAGK